jgi:hypothetical protein
MEFRGIQPERLLAVFLGASTYEESPNLADGSAFYNSANDLRNYLRNTYAVPRKNIKWLFDDSHSPSDQLNELARFLSERCAALKVAGTPAEDLLIYYVGHGLFAREQYCLAIRATKENNEAFSSIRGADLAGVAKEYARLLRRFLIFDCCFSAAIYKEFQFQAAPMTIARSQVTRELPLKGTSLLCSSNAGDPSFVSSRLGRTMFSDALIMSLTTGDISLGNPMSFSELGDLVRENLKTKYDGSWARPEVHSPDQREGDIAQLPMFPNAAYHSASAQLEQEKQAHARVAEQERLEQAKQARARAEQEWLELEKHAQLRAELEQLEQEKQAEVVRKEADQRSEREKLEQADQERSKREKQAQAQAEYERLEREKQAQAQAEQERLEREQKERTAKLGQQLYQKLMSEDLMGEERIRRLRTVLELSPDHMQAMRDLAAELHSVKRDYEAAEYLQCAIHMGLNDEAALREYAEIQTSIKNGEIEREAEQKRLEREKKARDRVEKEQLERERAAHAERERVEDESRAWGQQERLKSERRRTEEGQRAQEEKRRSEKAELERLEREKQVEAERERLEREKAEQERQERYRLEAWLEKAEQKRLESQARAEQRRLEREKHVQAWAEREPLERETQETRRREAEQERLKSQKQAPPESEEHTWASPEEAEHEQQLQMLDETWEAEKVKRDNELSRALVKEWSDKNKVSETPIIKQLRANVHEWVSKCPPGFEYRQIQRREKQRSRSREALNTWLREARAKQERLEREEQAQWNVTLAIVRWILIASSVGALVFFLVAVTFFPTATQTTALSLRWTHPSIASAVLRTLSKLHPTLLPRNISDLDIISSDYDHGPVFFQPRSIAYFYGDKYRLAFLSGGMRLLIADDEEVDEWDIADGRRVRTVFHLGRQMGDPRRILDLKVSPDDTLVAIATGLDHVRLISLDTGTEWRSLIPSLVPSAGSSPGYASQVAFSPDGKWIAATGDGIQITVWDVHSGTTVMRWSDPLAARSDSFEPGFSPNGQWFAAGNISDFALGVTQNSEQGVTFDPSKEKRRTLLWNTSDWQGPRSLPDSKGEIVFSQDSSLMALGSDIFDIRRSLRIGTLNPPHEPGNVVGYEYPLTRLDSELMNVSKQGFLVGLGGNGAVNIWSFSTGRLTSTRYPSSHCGGSFAVSPRDGSLAFLASINKDVDGSCVQELQWWLRKF